MNSATFSAWIDLPGPVVTAVSPLSGKSKALADFALVLGIVAVFGGVLHVAHQWERPLRASANIELSLMALPGYAFNSLVRGWLAYGCSLVFTLVVAIWAHRDLRARRFILPVLDVLQSLPVLGFMPGLVFALVALFPHSNTGLELACILMIFTGQVWNMTFSLYDSLCAVPADYRALARLHRYTQWQVISRIELPFAAQSLVYNSMVSMAGGWFFLSINEAFRLGDHDFRLPGLGAFMSVAVEHGDVWAQIAGAATMGAVIIAVDRLVWWPLALGVKRFRLDDSGSISPPQSAWWSGWEDSRTATWLLGPWRRWQARPRQRAEPVRAPTSKVDGWKIARRFATTLLLLLVGWGAWALFKLLQSVEGSAWWELLGATGLTFLRVLAAMIFSILWAVPMGIAIGLNPTLARRAQPWIQFAAAFPAPMLYPWILSAVLALGVGLNWGAIPLIALGTQWYILFNVISSASAIPSELKSATSLLRLSRIRQWRLFLLPAIFPGLVTGCIAAAGGAWNATVVAEYVHLGSELHTAHGLGSFLSRATETGRYAEVAAAALVMALCVVTLNLTVWRRLQALAQERCRYLV